ncbi:kinase-like domain-containing protein, partial [Rhizophagus diaphanus]
GPLTYDRHKKKYVREYFKEVALKSLDNSQNITNEFINEVKTYSIKSYSHSTIIKIYGISQDPDTKNYIMVLQYAKCGNFNNWIRYYSENINYDARLEVLCNIFNGLKEIHQMKMVHRDFHIGNILINNDHSLTLPNNNRYHLSTDINLPVTAYISDMGLCGEASNTDKTKIYGVMPYVAPEVLRNKPYTQAADVYSFGMVMYFIITGRQPFENRAHDQQLVLSICNGIRPEILEIPELKSNWYIDLMKKCWDPNPENRPNVESIGTILYDTNRLTLMDELEKAEKYLFDKGHREDDQLTTSPQTSYKSQVLNHYISEDLEAFDFTE